MARLPSIAALALVAACEQRGLQRQIEVAANRYAVPAPLLIGVAWVQSRLSMNGGRPSLDGGYGLFHIVDLDRAARLSGQPAGALKIDAQANALGFAALVREQADRVFGQYPDLREHELGDWFEVVMLASGIDDARVADAFATDVYRVLRDGLVAAAGDGSVVRLAPQSFDLSGRAIWGQIEQGLSGEYCPGGACVRFVAAAPTNFSAGRQSAIDRIVIHDMEGSYASAIAWFQNPASKVSAHYDLRSSDGEITQQVHHGDTAWHAGNWDINTRSIGIEHEGFAAEGTRWYSEAMYRSSAALVRFLTDKYGVPKDRAHIIGHYEVPDPNHAGWYGGAGHHHDPCHSWAGSPTWHNVSGCDWNWQHYMELVTGSSPPVANGTLTGFVGDACCGIVASTRKPLASATVTLAGTAKTAATDAQGMYTFSLPAGVYTPRASMAGFESADHGSLGAGFSAAIDVSAAQTSWASILLKKQAVVAAPAVAITAPQNGATVWTAAVTVRGTVDDKTVGQVRIDGATVSCSNGVFAGQRTLVAGRNTITVTATNAGGTGSASITVTYEPAPPPPAGKGTVLGTVSSSAGGRPIAGASAASEASGATQSDAQGRYRLDLDPGDHVLTFAKDGFEGASVPIAIQAGAIAAADVELRPSDTSPPPGPRGSIAILTPPDGIETGDDAVLVSGKVDLANLVSLTIGGRPAAAAADGTFSSPTLLAEGVNTIVVRAVDKDGAALEAAVHVVYTRPAPPLQHLVDPGCSSGAGGPIALLGLAVIFLVSRRRR